MAGSDLRRKAVLRHLDLVGQSSPEEEEKDALGELPSLGNHELKIHHRPVNDGYDNENEAVLGWNDFFDHQERIRVEERNFEFNTYYSLPKSLEEPSIPVFVFHHGAGSSGLTFANLSKKMEEKTDGRCAVFAFDARGHGQTRPIDSEKDVSYALSEFVKDFVTLLDRFFNSHLSGLAATRLSIILVGHSLGASICTFSHSELTTETKKRLVGICMLDIVEEAAIKALEKVHTFLLSTPNVFANYEEAIDWHVSHGLSRCRESAQVAIPALFTGTKSGKIMRITNLKDFQPYWDTWFKGLSQRFVSSPTAKLLLLAGNENLDKELIIGQMQGMYQLVVSQDSGHFIQEDEPIKTAITLIDFWKRNDSRSTVIKSNWGKRN